MTPLRCLLAIVSAAAAISVAALLHWPGWSIAPLVVVLVLSLLYSVTAHRSPRRPGRADVGMLAVAAALTVATTVTAVVGVGDDDHHDVDPAVTAAATATFRTLFTFAPADFTAQAAQRRSEMLAPRLTGRLLADYRSQGPNVVLPSAVESRATLETTVQAVGVGEVVPDAVRLLVFAIEKITVDSATPPTSMVPIVRWAVMRRVGSTWRLADIYPAGIGG
ncbi:hypothetical protein [Williamsia maris]|uniref:Mce-associated membrane protein n=1 Tax=Williamsia maris TaxID=72806 RepID=A0ABT1HHX9_9NOCA|nr:hypothetical protein [Williamsia maris]MCP2177647.1 Mce-associated membrane protein [Williamsia maris]